MSGILKTEIGDSKSVRNQGIFSAYMVVNSITHQKKKNTYDAKKMKEMAKNPNIFYSFIKSFCPMIFGHELVKAGLLLAGVGGSLKNLQHDTDFREKSHVLLLGDPGIGKSQLLRFCNEVF